MSEHKCKDCKKGNDNTCTLTGACHETGIECPSFEIRKETQMFKIGDKVRVTANEERLKEIGIPTRLQSILVGAEGVIVTISDAAEGGSDGLNFRTDFGAKYDGAWWFAEQDLELVEGQGLVKCTECEHDDGKRCCSVGGLWFDDVAMFCPQFKPKPDPEFDTHPEGVLEVKDTDIGIGTPITLPIRTFASGVMTLERFDKLVDYIVEKRIKAVMCAKSAEYAQGTNKLHNFDRAATMRDITPLEALRGMKLKHEVSIEDMLDGLKDGKTYPRELWEEKFTDNINYQILEWAILARDNGWDQPVDRTAPTEGGH